jgi:1-acyl-sn-glycerol-3-phosphate acyltransferase
MDSQEAGGGRSIHVALRKVARTGSFIALTGVMLPAYVARDRLASDGDRSRVRDRWVRRWTGYLLKLFGVEVSVREEWPDAPPVNGRGRLVVSNHRSALDIGVMLHQFGGHVVSRADLAAWPLIGAAARSVGTVFVDRESAQSGAAMLRSVRTLVRAGETVILFPEGTTFEGDEVRPFHPASFVGAAKHGGQVVPVGIAYASGSGAAFVGESFTRHLVRMAGTRRTRVAVRVGRPLDLPAKASAAETAVRARSAVQELVGRARADVDGG